MPVTELTTQPAGEGELIKDTGKTARIWFSYQDVEFERRYGYFKRDGVEDWTQNNLPYLWPINETRKYADVSKASLDRLHAVVSKWVMEGKAGISIFQMKDGAGYEVTI